MQQVSEFLFSPPFSPHRNHFPPHFRPFVTFQFENVCKGDVPANNAKCKPSSAMVENTPALKKVFLIDDQVSVRELLRLFISQCLPECQVAGEASTAAEAHLALGDLHPDVVIADVFLPDMAAVPFFTAMHEYHPAARMVAFCRWIEPPIARRLISVGVNGIALKDERLDNLRTAIRAVLSGGCYVPAALEQSLYAQLQGQKHLTDRETQVIQLIAEGFATKEVGDKLSISVKTAEKYREKSMAKLGVHDVVHLTRYAIRHGLAAL